MKEKLRNAWKTAVKNGKYVFPVIVCLAVAITVVVALRAKGVRNDELEKIGETIQSPTPMTESSSDPASDEVALKKNDDPQNEAADPVTTSAGTETTKVTEKVTTSGKAKKTSMTSEETSVTVSSTVSYVQNSINTQNTDNEEIASQKQENNTLERFLFPVVCSAIMIAVCAAVVISIIKGGS